MRGDTTIIDLAKISGVSKSTVSRYLHGSGVSDTKARLIAKAITETGYARNNYAQLLRVDKSNFIGIVIPDLDNPFFTAIISEFEKLAHEHNKTIIIKTTNRDIERELGVINFIRGFKVEMIFLCRSELSDDIVKDLASKVPIISIDKKFKSINSVVSNNYKSAYDLTKHVFSQGFNKVMFFSRIKEGSSVSERCAGYFAYCNEYRQLKFSYRYDRLTEIDYNNLLSYIRDNKIEAVIARNDIEAISLQAYFNDLYYKSLLPKIQVYGFDNIKLANLVLPRLTTMDQKISNLCKTAYGIYKNYEENKAKAYVQEAELIVRDNHLYCRV